MPEPLTAAAENPVSDRRSIRGADATVDRVDRGQCQDGSIEVLTVRTLADLEVYGEEWNRLATAARQQLPMLSYAWVSAYLSHRVLPEESWFCLLAREHGRLIGVLPLVASPRRLLGRQGCVLRTPRDEHTLTGDLVAAPGREQEVARTLVR